MIKLPTTTGEMMVFCHKVDCLRSNGLPDQCALITDAGITHIITLPMAAVYEAMQAPVMEALREALGTPLNG